MILQRLEQLLLPQSCAFCGTRCEPHETGICLACLEDMPWREQLLTEEQAPIDVCVAPFEYAFPIDAALKALKFRRRLDYVPALSEILWRASYVLPTDIDAVLPVPLHWRRQATRGFNQAVELSQVFRKQTGLPMLTNFVRARATPFQSGLEADARYRNLRKAFVARGRCGARHVLIIDDVMTTGATCKELAKVVLAAGADKVSVLAVARTG